MPHARSHESPSFSFDDAPALPRWLENELPYRRRVANVDGRRIHFIDEGAGPPVVLFHGNPTWSFVWRKVIARLRDRGGLRILAPDLLGLGLSDKPASPSDHTLELHVRVVSRFLEALELEPSVIVAQDWGGPIGVGAAMLRSEVAPGFVRGLVLSNTSVLEPRRPLRPSAFHRLAQLPIASDVLFRGLMFPVPVLDRVQGDRRSIGAREKAAYAWPLRHARDRAAPLGLARMVPNHDDHPTLPWLARIDAFVRAHRGPAALVWGERDPILGRALSRHREALPHAQVEATSAGHFLQEEVPDELAHAIRAVAGV